MKRLNEAGPTVTKRLEQTWLADRQKLQDKRTAIAHMSAIKTKRYKINEIFYTIQGEGIHAGAAAVFIRFSACNLSCSWCDTEYDSGVKMEAKTIWGAVAATMRGHGPEITRQRKRPVSLPIIVCTGGEPSLQVDQEFVDTFKEFTVTMETNGIKWTDALHALDVVTVSPKSMEGWWSKDVFEGRANVVFKLVYDPSNPEMEEMMEQVLQTQARAWFLQPLEDQENGSTNVKEVIKIVQSDPRWRLSLQTHKVLGLR